METEQPYEDQGQGTEPESGADETVDTSGGPDVQPVEGDQGAPAEQDAPAAGGPADPDAPVSTSPPAPEEQSGVPALPENEGVEPGNGEDTPAEGGTPAEGDSPAEPSGE